jgi:hypothetical protein
MWKIKENEWRNRSFKAKSKMAEGRKKNAQRIQRQISRKGLSKVTTIINVVKISIKL